MTTAPLHSQAAVKVCVSYKTNKSQHCVARAFFDQIGLEGGANGPKRLNLLYSRRELVGIIDGGAEFVDGAPIATSVAVTEATI